jgi:hypothetical protein
MSSQSFDRAIEGALAGALKVWGVEGSVFRESDGFALRAATGTELRVVRAAPRGWRIFRDTRLVGEAAGLPGLLRRLREELAPGIAGGRLIIGSQSLL